MMKRYENDTHENPVAMDRLGNDVLSEAFKEWEYKEFAELSRKATAYDRLMSGGKKTLKEIANFLGNPVAVDREGRLLWFPRKPEIGLTTWIWYDKYLPKNIFDYTGDWKDSPTLPDGWEE